MLKEYKRKRNFEKTSEPIGTTKKIDNKKLKFVVQLHHARALHYDFRLEYRGVLLSFAVPKGLPNKNERHLAILVENHPLDYINFKGIIPKGNYGAGKVEIFDKGTYVRMCNFDEGIKEGKLKFCLNGKKIKGCYSLIRMNDDNWIFVKELEQKIKNPLQKVDVKLCLLTKKIPSDNNYIYEIKYDGYRVVAYIENDKVVLKSRNNKDFTSKFQSVANSLKLLNKTTILDGEIVVFDKKGRSDFSLLQKEIKKSGLNFVYVVFDILALAGEDIRKRPLSERKKILKEILKNCDSNILYSEHIQGSGKKLFSFAKKNKLEGIVAKNVNSIYNSKRDDDWLKLKCYLQQEFVIVGFTLSEKLSQLSSILLGYYKDNDLIYVGKSGTGFTTLERKDLKDKLSKIVVKNHKIKNFNESTKNTFFVKPKYVAQLQFAELTKDKKLRQASFLGLREDKKPKSVVLEVENEK